jgi:hypothetical protein
VAVNEFSNDENLGNSDSAVPTQKAVKTYVDNKISDEKINALESKINDLESTINNLESKNNDLESKINNLEINIRLFFKYMGILLLFIVAGLVVSTLGLFDSAVNILSQEIASQQGCVSITKDLLKSTLAFLGQWSGIPRNCFPKTSFPVCC